MANNPINYSDFIKPDGSVSDLIAQLKELLSTYEGMSDKVKKSAAELEKALKLVNSTTEAGREATRKAATDSEKLATEEKKLADAKRYVGREIQRLRAETTKQNNINKLTIALNKAAEGSYDKLSAQYSLNKIKLNAMSAAQRETTTSGKKLETQTREIYEEMNRLQKATGKHTLSVGDYKIATENLHPALGRVNSALAEMGTSLTEIQNEPKPFAALLSGAKAFGAAAVSFLLSPLGLILTAAAAIYYLISSNKQSVIDFDSSLKNVGKTTNLAGQELRDFGQDVVGLSTKLKTIAVKPLLDYAAAAGQLGVKGRDNLLAFAETLGMLEQATNINGEEGAAAIARILTLTDGGVQNVAAFGDEITNLGNNFAANEAEILGNATRIAQATTQYRVGRQAVLAYATATKAVGVESELAGATLGRTYSVFEKALRTGQGIDALVKLTGKNIDELKTQFKESPDALFTGFLGGLNKVSKAGGSVNAELEKIGVTGDRDRNVIATLATQGFDVLTDALDKSAKSSAALSNEFEASSKKIENQIKRVGIAWDNLVLTIEDGEGAIGKSAAAIAGAIATYFDKASESIRLAAAFYEAFVALFKESVAVFKEVFSALAAFKDIKIDFSNPMQAFRDLGGAAAGALDAMNPKKNAKRLFSSFNETLLEELARSKAAINKAAAAASGATGDKIDAALKNGIATVGELDEAIAALNDKLKGTRSRKEAKAVQDEIKELERKRDAILGIVKAKAKEKAFTEIDKRKAEVDVMEDGQSKDMAALAIELDEKTKLFQKYGLDVAKVTEYGERQKLAIIKKYIDIEGAERKKVQDEETARVLKEMQEARERYSNSMSVIDEEYALRLSEIDILKTIEAEKTKLRLEAEKDRLKKVLDLNANGEKMLSDMQLQTIKNTIAKIDQEIGQGDKDNRDIYSAFGLKLEDDQKQAIEDSINFAVDGLKSILAAKVEAADKALEINRSEGDAIQSRYDQEIEARNNGYANDALGVQKELELNKTREAQLLKEKQKAQKAQELLDTASQASSLVSASANIWNSLSAIPVVGPALAIAAIATMFGSFAASKIKAKTATKEKYGDGGLEFLEGGSHASGNDIPIGMTRGGKQRTAEGGEALAIINRKNTRKYKGVIPGIIKSLNSGTFENLYGAAFMNSEALPPAVFNNNFDSPELKDISANISEMNKRAQVQRYIDGQGRTVETYKNIKRTYV